MQKEGDLVQLDFEDRPWGSWQVLDEAPGYKVKRIRVSGGSRLSLQTHQHRAEHWVVVSGVATCTVGQGTRRSLAGDSVDVPQGAAHRVANDELEELVIIEAQRGAYTGEDDIVRLEDDYGRLADR
jgi:mannose-6-phosphate isomerase-like protein (cupin superfamily)